MKLAILLLFPAMAMAAPRHYDVGTVLAHHYTNPATTVSCSDESGMYTQRETCSAEDSSSTHAYYEMTFAEGYTRLIYHVSPWGADPLKEIGAAPVKVEYRVRRRGGVLYVYVLDARGKEGVYTFVSHDDDPAWAAQHNAKALATEKANGPAVVKP